MALLEKFHQICKEELTSILLKLFQNIEEKDILPNSLYETLLPKSEKDTRNENYRPIFLMKSDTKKKKIIIII